MRARSLRLAVFAAMLSVVLPGVADAKTFEVTRTNDPVPGNCQPNDCSLREAVLAANERAGADKVVLPARSYKLTRVGAGEDAGVTGDLDINNDPVAISHPGKGMAKIDADGIDRVLHIQAGAPTKLSRIGVVGGETTDNGGGILHSARLKLVRSMVSGNDASFDGGGIDAQDGAPLVLSRSAVLDNESGDDGGGVNGAGNITVRRSRIMGNSSDEQGGGIRTTDVAPKVVVVGSLVSGNIAGTVGGGIEVESVKFVMRDSTVAGNRADGNGAGLHSTELTDIKIDSSTISGNRAIGPSSNGGGVYLDGPTAKVRNSTISGNRANQRGGGIHAQDGADLTLNAVTVTHNAAAADDNVIVQIGGGGLSRISSAGFDVRNSLIALNTIGAPGNKSRNDCSGDTAFDSLGNNLISEIGPVDACDSFDGPNDIVRSNPKIGQLKSNGGPTKTVALKNGSKAIGSAHKPSAPKRDQRGRKRDGNPDIGAFERGA